MRGEDDPTNVYGVWRTGDLVGFGQASAGNGTPVLAWQR